MLFALTCHDRPGALALRTETRPAHLDYLRGRMAALVQAGPLLDGEGRPCGSLFVLDLPDRDAVEAFAAADPYTKAGLFAGYEIHGFRSVFRDGSEV